MKISESERELLIARIKESSRPLLPEPSGERPVLQVLPGIRAILFDVYGTLFISGSGDISIAGENSNAEALQSALSSAGYQILGSTVQAGAELLRDFQELIIQCHQQLRELGIDSPEIDVVAVWTEVLGRSIAAGKLDGEVCPARMRRFAVEYECCVNPVWPMPGLDELLSSLRQRRMPLGIVSNAQFFTPLLFDAFLGVGLDDNGFDRRLCSWSWQLRRAKPSLKMFAGPLNELAKRQISPHEVLYVGNDCLNDIWSAASLGIKTALFAGDRRSLRRRQDDVRCAQLTPDLVITDLRQLLEWVRA